MSTVSTVLNNGQQAISNFELSKIFILNNRYENDNYINNSSYDPITILAGTLMGRIASTGVLVPLNASANDGSQFPLGILAQDLVVPGSTTVQGTICVSGDVAQEKVILFFGNTLDTVVSGRRLRDLIGASTVGIKLVPGTEMTQFDNQ